MKISLASTGDHTIDEAFLERYLLQSFVATDLFPYPVYQQDFLATSLAILDWEPIQKPCICIHTPSSEHMLYTRNNSAHARLPQPQPIGSVSAAASSSC